MAITRNVTDIHAGGTNCLGPLATASRSIPAATHGVIRASGTAQELA